MNEVYFLEKYYENGLEKKKQGTANAMYLSFMDLGIALGSFALGIVAGAMGYRFIYGFSIIFLVVLIIIYTFTFGIRRQQKHVTKKAS